MSAEERVLSSRQDREPAALRTAPRQKGHRRRSNQAENEQGDDEETHEDKHDGKSPGKTSGNGVWRSNPLNVAGLFVSLDTTESLAKRRL